MKAKLPGVLMALFVLGAAAPLFAHHGFGVEFDATKCADLKGTLTNITWENPHAYFDMDVNQSRRQGGDVAPRNGHPQRPEKDRQHERGFPREYRQDDQRKGVSGQGRRKQRRCQLPGTV